MGDIPSQTSRRQGAAGAIGSGGIRDVTHSRSVNYPVWASEIERAEETLESLLRALMDATEGYLRAAKYAAPLMLNVETHGLPALRTDGRLI